MNSNNTEDMRPRYVASLDLSKTSTGLAIGEANLQDNSFRIVNWCTIRPHAGARPTRWLYAAGDSILDGIKKTLSPLPWFKERLGSIAIEANIWGESSSEFQYHLAQSLLRWAQDENIDVVAYNPATVKAWVRLFARTELPAKMGGKQGKAIIERVWRQDLRTRAPDRFPNPLGATDDQIDAGWIALLALYAHVPYLPVDDTSSLFWEGDADPFRAQFMKHKLHAYTCMESPDMSKFYVNMRNNKHLGTISGSFYPFRQLAALAAQLRTLYQGEPDQAVEWIQGRANRDLSLRSIKATLDGGPFKCGLDAAGKLLIYPAI